jgi:MFS family permease
MMSLYLLGAAWGAMAFPLYAIAVAYTNDLADPSEYVTISSSLLLAYGIGAIAGPFLASTAISLFGSNMLFAQTSIIHLLLVLFAIGRWGATREKPHEEHVEFSDALTAARTASQVFEEEVWTEQETDRPH